MYWNEEGHIWLRDHDVYKLSRPVVDIASATEAPLLSIKPTSSGHVLIVLGFHINVALAADKWLQIYVKEGATLAGGVAETPGQCNYRGNAWDASPAIYTGDMEIYDPGGSPTPTISSGTQIDCFSFHSKATGVVNAWIPLCMYVDQNTEISWSVDNEDTTSQSIGLSVLFYMMNTTLNPEPVATPL